MKALLLLRASVLDPIGAGIQAGLPLVTASLTLQNHGDLGIERCPHTPPAQTGIWRPQSGETGLASCTAQLGWMEQGLLATGSHSR